MTYTILQVSYDCDMTYYDCFFRSFQKKLISCTSRIAFAVFYKWLYCQVFNWINRKLICKLFKQHIAKSNFLEYPRRDEMLFQLSFDKCKSLNYLWRFHFTIPYIKVGWSDVYQIRNFVRDTAFYELGFLSFRWHFHAPHFLKWEDENCKYKLPLIFN